MYVCDKCIGDDGLSEVIRDNAEDVRCDYCGHWDKRRVVADMDTVVDHMLRCIAREYCDPQESLLYDDESESGYAGDTWYTEELLTEVIGFSVSVSCPKEAKLFRDICASLDQHSGLWASNDPGGLPLGEDLLYDWANFRRVVCHRQRFFAFDIVEPVDRDHALSPSSFFRFLHNSVNDLGLVKGLAADTVVFRARKCKSVKGPLDVGPPSEELARQNRMSPAGIPMLYATRSAETALREVYDRTDTYHVAMLRLCRPVKILDLATLPPIPSYWSTLEPSAASRRERLLFWYRFAHELARPVADEGRIHIEYVPTQVLTEYFRVAFKLPNGARLDGIAYPSAKHAGGTCYVIFATQDDLFWSRKEIEACSGFGRWSREEKQKSAWVRLLRTKRYDKWKPPA